MGSINKSLRMIFLIIDRLDFFYLNILTVFLFKSENQNSQIKVLIVKSE